MKKSILVAAVAALALNVSSPCSAFSLGGVTNALSGHSSGGTDLAATQKNTVADYVSANKLVINANMKMAQALHLDGQVAALKASADALKAGTSEDSLKKSDTAVSQSTDEIVKKLNSNPKLDTAAKATFASGLASLVEGGLSYRKVSKDLASAQSSMSSASPMELTKVGELVYIGKTAPANVKNFSGALSSAIDFAKSENIPVPANAADATSALGNF